MKHSHLTLQAEFACVSQKNLKMSIFGQPLIDKKKKSKTPNALRQMFLRKKNKAYNANIYYIV